MVCHEMAFLPPPPSDHHQYFLHHHPQLHNPQDFLGGVHDSSLTMMNHQHHHHNHQMTSPAISGHGGAGGDVDHDDLSDDGSQLVLGEKKKRLSLEQVKTLEKNFELGNKLEPERKLQLAKALGLQPRQVAIWFQNRRARWKTKQLEKDYNVLKRQFDAIRSDNDSLLSLNKKLHSELLALKSGGNATNPTTSAQEGVEFGSINLNTTTTKSYCNWSNNGSEISSDINLGMSTTISPTSHQEESPSSNNNNNNNKLQFVAPHFIPTSLTDLLTSSSSTPSKPSDHPHHQIQDDSFCSLFGGGVGGGGGGGVGEQPPFWGWAPSSLN
ncbi:hypothetical protein V2J09_012443 [Rumex salicifolius]